MRQVHEAPTVAATPLLPHGAPPAAAPIVAAFQSAGDAKARLRLLLDYAKQLPPFPEEFKTVENRVMGCSAQVRRRRSAAAARGP
jgi:sulfur transfer protein SufE